MAGVCSAFSPQPFSEYSFSCLKLAMRRIHVFALSACQKFESMVAWPVCLLFFLQNLPRTTRCLIPLSRIWVDMGRCCARLSSAQISYLSILWIFFSNILALSSKLVELDVCRDGFSVQNWTHRSHGVSASLLHKYVIPLFFGLLFGKLCAPLKTQNGIPMSVSLPKT